MWGRLSGKPIPQMEGSRFLESEAVLTRLHGRFRSLRLNVGRGQIVIGDFMKTPTLSSTGRWTRALPVVGPRLDESCRAHVSPDRSAGE